MKKVFKPFFFTSGEDRPCCNNTRYIAIGENFYRQKLVCCIRDNHIVHLICCVRLSCDLCSAFCLLLFTSVYRIPVVDYEIDSLQWVAVVFSQPAGITNCYYDSKG